MELWYTYIFGWGVFLSRLYILTYKRHLEYKARHCILYIPESKSRSSSNAIAKFHLFSIKTQQTQLSKLIGGSNWTTTVRIQASFKPGKLRYCVFKIKSCKADSPRTNRVKRVSRLRYRYYGRPFLFANSGCHIHRFNCWKWRNV